MSKKINYKKLATIFLITFMKNIAEERRTKEIPSCEATLFHLFKAFPSETINVITDKMEYHGLDHFDYGFHKCFRTTDVFEQLYTRKVDRTLDSAPTTEKIKNENMEKKRFVVTYHCLSNLSIDILIYNALCESKIFFNTAKSFKESVKHKYR